MERRRGLAKHSRPRPRPLACFERIRAFQREGRTILFVSHDADAVRAVANRALWLDRGQIRADGPLGPIVTRYLAEARHEQVPEGIP